MDILTVREATKFAADYARSGKVTSHCFLDWSVCKTTVKTLLNNQWKVADIRVSSYTLKFFYHQVNFLVKMESYQDNHDKSVSESFLSVFTSISDSYLSLPFPKPTKPNYVC